MEKERDNKNKKKTSKLFSNILCVTEVYVILSFIIYFALSKSFMGLLFSFGYWLMLFPVIVGVTILFSLKDKEENSDGDEKSNLSINMILKYRIKNIKKYYELNSSDKDENLDEYKKMIVSYLDENANNILDLGVGDGDELENIYLRFPMIKVKAIDLRENVSYKLKERFKNVDFLCGDFFEVEFEDDYDAVVASNSLSYYDYNLKCRLYKKIYDCLKEDGMLISLDRFFQSENDEIASVYQYMNQIDTKEMIETPLCALNEVKILKSIGFKNIEFIETGNSEWKLLIAKK